MNQLAMLKLFNLISPALPVGAFAYSQGLEWAIEEGGVDTPDRIADWIGSLLTHNFSHTDIPALKRLYQAIARDDARQVLYWNHWTLASRETQELLEEDRQVASALLRILKQQEIGWPQSLASLAGKEPMSFEPSLLFAWALGAHHWQIDLTSTAMGYCWSWAENQITVAGKTLPLGQTQAQKILAELMPLITRCVDTGLTVDDEHMGQSLPGWIMACARHETQYSRLFRS